MRSWLENGRYLPETSVSDLSYLEWPFFEPSHRSFAAALRAWLAGLPRAPDGDVIESCTWWVRNLGTSGWLAHCVPKPFGGVSSPLDVRALCLAREILAYHDGLADFAFAMQALGSGPIGAFGSDEQRAAYLPQVARGERVAAFALSERDAGSDVGAIQTKAVREGSSYILDGEKTWISNGGFASFYVVFARTGDHRTRGLSAFIVNAETPGLQIVERIETLSPHPLATIRFSGCRVGEHARIGEEGKGFTIAMSVLDTFRSTVGAAALGFARRAFFETLQHVRKRKMFGDTLGAFQLTQSKIATMATDIDASALLVYRAAYAKDTGAVVTREAAMAKWFATEAAQRVVDSAVQLFGGRGVRRGEVVERLYRDVRALRIYEGASEVQQLIIARNLLAEPP